MTSEYLTKEELEQRSGLAFFKAEGRLEKLRSLVGAMRVRTDRDEVWVSALDFGSQHVRRGQIFGLRVVVTSALGPGELRVWSYGEGRFV